MSRVPTKAPKCTTPCSDVTTVEVPHSVQGVGRPNGDNYRNRLPMNVDIRSGKSHGTRGSDFLSVAVKDTTLKSSMSIAAGVMSGPPSPGQAKFVPPIGQVTRGGFARGRARQLSEVTGFLGRGTPRTAGSAGSRTSILKEAIVDAGTTEIPLHRTGEENFLVETGMRLGSGGAKLELGVLEELPSS
ncbi:unnamed protein product, partial [Ectocarpus sp. 12 AP-2014]